MADHALAITVQSGILAVCRFDAAEPIPGWALGSPFCSITRTDDELSVVCIQDLVPDGARGERGWRCLKLEGPLPLTLVGVLSSVLAPLAEARVSIFALSTFDTDYVLIRDRDLDAAIRALRAAGHRVHT